MKFRYILIIVLLYCPQLFSDTICRQLTQEVDATWLIAGDGPAGIVTIGLLLDLGIPQENIIWIGPEFNVGRLGKYYYNVPGNTKTQLFIDFFKACGVFCECNAPSVQKLYNYDLDKEYTLSIVIEPLQEITDYLRTKIRSYETLLTSLHYEDEVWHCGTTQHTFTCQHVVLATGSHPRTLQYPCDCEIPLDIALDKTSLARSVEPHDTVGVVGSAHSAILVLKYLTELPVARILNFYLSDPKFAIDMGSWVLHGYDGLGGLTAQWAKEVLLKNPPDKLIRIYNTKESRKAWLPICSKLVYAVGYERNDIPTIMQNPELSYDQQGVIAPRLFGIGIAFPENYTDPQGNVESKVGLAHFMEYAQQVIPSWVATKDIKRKYRAFEKLFSIELL